VVHGPHSLTIRLIETYAGVNSSLIGYYFGGLNGLLTELLHANLDLILADRARRLAGLAHTGRKESAEAVLEAFLRSLWREAAYTQRTRIM
jgi:AcrR family transcriptional regulator